MDNEKTIELFPRGVVTPPPSKSLSHRALICASLAAFADAKKDPVAAARRRIKNLGDSDDITATADGLGQILHEATLTSVKAGLPKVIDCRESGSTLRFLIPVSAALTDREIHFTGSGRLMERPMGAYKDIFQRRGLLFEQNTAGLRIQGELKPGVYELPGDVSSQFVSGLLFALPLLGGDSEIVLTTPLESADYVRMTLDVMADFGVEAAANEDGSGWKVTGKQHYKAAKYRVETDWSQAAFFLGAAALGRSVYTDGLNPDSIQGDRRIMNVLTDMGAYVDGEMRAFPRRNTCTMTALPPPGGLRAVTIDVSGIPDLVPPVAAIACYAAGTTRLVNAGRLRIKESDRLKALVTELSKIGANIKEEDDALIIVGQTQLAGGSCISWNDHRIAMALALAAIGCKDPVRLTGWESVKKSYPNFWTDFEKEAIDGAEARQQRNIFGMEKNA
ncbi:MAG: 3-phosphoshikimate 1-carboxyvinyltransferase [Clostridiales Family XIII bacterium]|jgi:3-phosphoshikimate 1-carboxyvinyltransferase|nr:3-phosphoshikimate 1-carboxyvinyltransferase [Clostridiales Family XIII bacterium]